MKSFPLTLLARLLILFAFVIVCFTPFLVLAIWRSRPDRHQDIALAVGVSLMFMWSLVLMQKLFVFSSLELDWSSKLYVIVASLVFIGLWRNIEWSQIGFAGVQKGSWVPFIVVAVFLTIFGSPVESDSTSLEQAIYEFFTYAISEELIFRGIMLALLNRAFDKPWKVLGASVGWGWILSSVLFGLFHGGWVNSQFQLQYSITPVIFTGFGALIMGWLRERTGSLYPPMIVHGLGDGFRYIMAWIGAG